MFFKIVLISGILLFVRPEFKKFPKPVLTIRNADHSILGTNLDFISFANN